MTDNAPIIHPRPRRYRRARYAAVLALTASAVGLGIPMSASAAPDPATATADAGWNARSSVLPGTPLSLSVTVDPADQSNAFDTTAPVGGSFRAQVEVSSEGDDDYDQTFTWNTTSTGSPQSHTMTFTAPPNAGEYDVEVTGGAPDSPFGLAYVGDFDLTVASPPVASTTTRVSMSAVTGTRSLNSAAPLTGVVTDSSGKPVSGMPVDVEVSTRSGWATVPGSTVTTDAQGRYTDAAPTYFYGIHTYRVHALGIAAVPAGYNRAAKTGWAPSLTGAGSVQVPLDYRPKGKSTAYTFISTHETRSTQGLIRWNPCQVIPYYINFKGAPKGFSAALVAQALGKVSAATGLRFTYAGPTASEPWTATAPHSGGLYIGWATPKSVPDLGGGTIGVGGPAAHRSKGDTPVNYLGQVSLDKTYHNWNKNPWRETKKHRGAPIGTLLMHEIGHAIGLDHTKTKADVMHEGLNLAQRGKYEAGDLHGLDLLGLNSGCTN